MATASPAPPYFFVFGTDVVGFLDCCCRISCCTGDLTASASPFAPLPSVCPAVIGRHDARGGWVWTSSPFRSIAEHRSCAETAMLRDDSGHGGGRPDTPRNVLGDRLEVCSINPMTGFFRDGCCDTGQEDIGSHTVCAVMTAAFLEFSKSRGNDLSTPVPEFGFRGLKPGDRWCLCAPRWQEALEAGQAPRVVLRATHEGALDYCSLADLKRLAVDLA
jgi:uncharacterized protein (DUF2237 family)